MSDVLRLRLRGEGIHPQTFRASDLAQLLIDLEQAVIVEADISAETAAATVVLALVGIEDASCGTLLSVDAQAVPATEKIITSLEQHSMKGMRYHTQQIVRRIFNRYIKRGWQVDVGWAHSKRVVTVSESNPPPLLDQSAIIRGFTTLYGQLIQVGGVNPCVKLKLHNRSYEVTVQVSKPQAMALKDSLYKDVLVDGRATWELVHSERKIVSFVLTKIQPLPQLETEEAFERLGRAAGKDWDGVDPVEFVRELRGSDEN